MDHSILIGKLEHLGIRGMPLELLKSYLSGRNQYVIFGDAESHHGEISVGVPQGSILGPLFFLIYINDLSAASSFFRYILFADDTNLFASSKNKGDLLREVNLELTKLSVWFAHNKLTLNYGKTEFVNFSKPKKGKTEDKWDLQMDGRLINEVESSKFLGVFIDKEISWRVHIGKIITKISQTVGIIGQARRFMSEPQLFLLYNTMVLPHLQYCLINWGNFKGDHNLGLGKRLLTLQKCFLRIICGADRISHADPLFSKLGTFKVDDLFTQSVRVFSYQQSKGMLPDGMSALVKRAAHGHFTRGARDGFFVDRSHGRSIRSIAPRLWNSLPLRLKQSPSVAAFKDGSKMDLLAPYASFVCTRTGCPSCVGVRRVCDG